MSLAIEFTNKSPLEKILVQKLTVSRWYLKTGTKTFGFMVFTVSNYTITTLKWPDKQYSVNEPNDRWMKEKIQDNEYASKSELINALIRRQRELEEERIWLRSELIIGEKSGLSS